MPSDKHIAKFQELYLNRFKQEIGKEEAREKLVNYQREHNIGSVKETRIGEQQRLDKLLEDYQTIATQRQRLEKTAKEDLAKGVISDGDKPKAAYPACAFVARYLLVLFPDLFSRTRDPAQRDRAAEIKADSQLRELVSRERRALKARQKSLK